MALEYIAKKGIYTEEDYPYRLCNEEFNNKDKVDSFFSFFVHIFFYYNTFFGLFLKLKECRVVTIDGYMHVPSNNEKKLQQAIAKQPI